MREVKKVFSVYTKVILGEVMITQVSGLSSGVATKDPRRKAQRIQFRHSTQIPYQSSYNK